jgi:GDPmannose 4,6-dehydratase
MKRALICGVSGQDGAYLAHLLVQKNYEVWGIARRVSASMPENLIRLGVQDRVRVETLDVQDYEGIRRIVKDIQPAEIYHLAGQSSVSRSLESPKESIEGIVVGTLNLLEAIRLSGYASRLYNACSSECFGDNGGAPADESTPFHPRSPYAVAKAAAFWEVANYRETYGLFACSGILFNHESPLRPEHFVTRKIIAAAMRIAAGDREKLRLGDLELMRDWGWAPEYVEAMWLMLQQTAPEDFIIATGETHSLQEFVEAAFAHFQLDWREHVVSDPALLRRTDVRAVRANPSKAAKKLNWRARFKMKDVIRKMIEETKA